MATIILIGKEIKGIYSKLRIIVKKSAVSE